MCAKMKPRHIGLLLVTGMKVCSTNICNVSNEKKSTMSNGKKAHKKNPNIEHRCLLLT